MLAAAPAATGNAALKGRQLPLLAAPPLWPVSSSRFRHHDDIRLRRMFRSNSGKSSPTLEFACGAAGRHRVFDGIFKYDLYKPSFKY